MEATTYSDAYFIEDIANASFLNGYGYCTNPNFASQVNPSAAGTFFGEQIGGAQGTTQNLLFVGWEIGTWGSSAHTGLVVRDYNAKGSAVTDTYYPITMSLPNGAIGMGNSSAGGTLDNVFINGQKAVSGINEGITSQNSMQTLLEETYNSGTEPTTWPTFTSDSYCGGMQVLEQGASGYAYWPANGQLGSQSLPPTGQKSSHDSYSNNDFSVYPSGNKSNISSAGINRSAEFSRLPPPPGAYAPPIPMRYGSNSGYLPAYARNVSLRRNIFANRAMSTTLFARVVDAVSSLGEGERLDVSPNRVVLVVTRPIRAVESLLPSPRLFVGTELTVTDAATGDCLIIRRVGNIW